uniref:PH domain-containing protein n=1 Tax=Streptomyces sp. NBC_01393 TaxID=2903851 RepID=A0AAU3HXP0_9ACTN
MRETIRIPWVAAVLTLAFQIPILIGLGVVDYAPGAIRPWLYGAGVAGWALLTWRTATARLQVSPEGIRSHGTWRTRFVPWEDLVWVSVLTSGSLWEFPVAFLSDGRDVPLTGVYGLRSDGESRVDRIAERLNTLSDQV